MNTTALRAAVLAVLWAALPPAHASASSSREWRFEVFLDDKPIGFHTFRLSDSGATRELRGEARFDVVDGGVSSVSVDDPGLYEGPLVSPPAVPALSPPGAALLAALLAVAFLYCGQPRKRRIRRGAR